MQMPQLSQLSAKGKVGYITALAGSALAALSFLAIPFVSLRIFGIFGSFSLLQLVQFVQLFSNVAGFLASRSGNATATPLSLVVGFIWLALVVTIVACIMALIFTLRAGTRALGGAISLIALGLIGAGIFLFIMIVVSTPYSSVAIGGWLCLLGMVATTIGGIAAIVGRPLAIATNVYDSGGVPQSSQYPSNPYTQYPPPPPSNPQYPQQTPPPPPPPLY
jgi:hypothetical protein